MAGAEIANAYLALYARMPGVERDIERQLGKADVDKVGEDLGKRASKGLLGGFALGGAVAGIVSTFTSAALKSISDLAGEAVAASDATDKFKDTLDFAGLDTTQIDSLTDSTRAYADATVYDLGDIQNTTAQLAANGVADFADLTEAAGNLNAIAGGNAETFKSVGSVLSQTAGAGKLTTENWNQLANAIPGASGKIQEALEANGAFVGDFREQMANGEITSDEFNQALLQLGSEPVAVEAAKSTDTLEGSLGGLQATVVGVMSDVISDLKPFLTDVINGFGDVVDGLGNVIGWIKENISWLTPLGIALGIAAVGYGAVNAAATIAAAGGLAKWIKATNLGKAAQEAFNLVMGANPIIRIVTLIIALVAALVWFFTQTELGQQIWQGFVDAIGTAWTWLWESVLKPVFDAIAAIFTWIFENIIMPIVTGIMIYIGLWAALFEWLWGTVLKPVFDAIGAVFEWIWNTIIKPIIDFIVAAVQVAGDIFTWLYQNIIKPVFDSVAAVFKWIWNTIIKPVVDFITGALTAVGDTVNKVFGGISDFIGGAFEAVFNVVKAPLNGLIDLINNMIDGLNDIKVDIPDWVPIVGGSTFGLNIPKIPKLAAGAIVTATPGGVLANIGEGRYDEAVLPLSPSVLGQLGGGIDGARFELVLDDGTPLRGYVKARAGEVLSASKAPYRGGRR